MDQDSERTSSLLAPKSSAGRRHSRTPGPGIVAGIDEVDALGLLSLRPSQANVLPLKQPLAGPVFEAALQSASVVPTSDAFDVSNSHESHALDESRTNPLDDMTIVAHSGRAGAAAESDESSHAGSSFPNAHSQAAAIGDGLASSPAASGVNSKRSPDSQRHGEHAGSARRSSKAVKPGRWLLLQWAVAGTTVMVAAWYVLQHPVSPQHERHWVSGRSR